MTKNPCKNGDPFPPEPFHLLPTFISDGSQAQFFFCNGAQVVTRYLYLPVMLITSVSEMSYCAHERKLALIPIPILIGVVVAGILRNRALKLSPYLMDAKVPWHLYVNMLFFTLIKLPGPYYPYWGRIFIPHFANGGLFRTLWFLFLWYRMPRKDVHTDLEHKA
ncbi:hypothetical protein E3N88_40082 [Mikania micrantha]|uniref:Uncharacterized protein n=1 Tax=Mikania micrantha TaxID=192012 RepID=A0A5N6LLP2_9ASTR|nr:hypothetical protein E3N88_40082 [Mikania micrantha]